MVSFLSPSAQKPKNRICWANKTLLNKNKISNTQNLLLAQVDESRKCFSPKGSTKKAIEWVRSIQSQPCKRLSLHGGTRQEFGSLSGFRQKSRPVSWHPGSRRCFSSGR